MAGTNSRAILQKGYIGIGGGMSKNDQFKKSPCTKCGKLTYHLCYVGTNLVCVDCFQKACDKAKEMNDLKEKFYEQN